MSSAEFINALEARAEHHCELCGGETDLAPYAILPARDRGADDHVLVCAVCYPQLDGTTELAGEHWYCLQEAAWSTVPAVQAISWRLLQRLSAADWARNLLEQIYLDEETQAWAAADSGAPSDLPPTLDSNGTALVDGDSVTLIKDLDVKGTSFVAKRGTLVKGIRLTDDPAHVEGRVNKVSIVLKTCFLKKA